MTSPAPDTSADWGYNDHSVDSAGGLDVGKATAPSDPMSFVPNDGAPISGSPDPLSGELSGGADWGYPNGQHGTQSTNP